MRKAGVLLATLAVVVTSGAHAGPSAPPGAAMDVRALGAALEANHPNLFRILRGEAPHFTLVAEVLDGLGIEGGTGPRELTFERRRASASP